MFLDTLNFSLVKFNLESLFLLIKGFSQSIKEKSLYWQKTINSSPTKQKILKKLLIINSLQINFWNRSSHLFNQLMEKVLLWTMKKISSVCLLEIGNILLMRRSHKCILLILMRLFRKYFLLIKGSTRWSLWKDNSCLEK